MKPVHFLLSRAVLVCGVLALLSCREPDSHVEVTPGASFDQYDFVYLTFEEDWFANHSIVQVLNQELERRSYSVSQGEPLPETRNRVMILHLSSAGQKKNPRNIESLSYLKGQLRDAASNRQLAGMHYSGGKLDRIEQKQMVRQVADRIFGAE